MSSRFPPQLAPGRGFAQATRREFLVGGALLSAAAVAAATSRASTDAVQDSSAAALDDVVPKTFGGWTEEPFANVLIPRAEKAQERSYDEVLTRYYAGRSVPAVMLLLAYGKAQVGGTELHRPEACYPVAGFKLHRQPDLLLHFPGVEVPARSMTATASDRTEQILYWTRVGSEFPTSSAAQRWSVLRQTFAGSVPDGVLFRISALSLDRGAGVAVLQRFATELLSSSGPDLRRLLTGRA